ncbi:MAG: DUF58 domain-containing protein, partial [Syntrophales bacterium]
GDLLGLCRKEKTLSFERDIVVFPRLLPLRDLEPPFRDYFGIHPAKGIIEDPAWYEGTREYSGNKPARNIHWKASARTDRLQTKEFTLPAMPPLVLDMARVPGPLEGRLSILTFWVLALFRKGVPVGLKMGEILYPPVHSPHQKHLLLRALALCGHEGEAHEG